jgi:hypothetical protein
MSKRNFMIAVALGLAGAGWYAFRPELLFIDRIVNEKFPGTSSQGSFEKDSMPITKGHFKSLAHETKGTASIEQLDEGKRPLRLTDFETSNGPDVRVYLTAAEVAKNSDAITQAGEQGRPEL